jgi:DNA-directed RNA polymerase subunit RPC12/RpoP
MNIIFVYYYFLVCSKCGTKITELSVGNSSYNNQHSFRTDGGNSCPSCGEVKEFNVVSAVTKVFKE